MGGKNRGGPLKLFGDVDGICSDGIIDRIPRTRLRFCDRGSDCFQDIGDVAKFGRSANGGGDGATILMAHNENQWYAKVLDRVFDAADIHRINDLSGSSNHEDVAETDVEYQFGRDARIGATEDESKRLLVFGQRGTPGEEVWAPRRRGFSGDEPFVASE